MGLSTSVARECKRCGGSALRDYAYGCVHVFDDTPTPLVEIVEVRGESVYHASHNGAAPHVLHPGEVGVREGWREAWRDKAIEDAQARDRDARAREVVDRMNEAIEVERALCTLLAIAEGIAALAGVTAEWDGECYRVVKVERDP